jgi:uncharacterized protein (TIGR04255 family)
MKIPKKISPDNLKDTVIQILFNPGVAPELVLGAFNYGLSDTFKFVASQPAKKGIKVSANDNFLLESIQKGYFLDQKELVKVDITSNSISFNTFQEYIGWDNYYPVICNTLTKLFEIGVIKEINRIGIRYISQFDNTNLFENLNMTLSIDVPNKAFEATQVRSEFTDANYKVIMTLINKIKSTENLKEINTSIIDIDVIQLFEGLNNAKETIIVIEEGHQKQKHTFFTLLKPAFLATLNPEY